MYCILQLFLLKCFPLFDVVDLKHSSLLWSCRSVIHTLLFSITRGASLSLSSYAIG